MVLTCKRVKRAYGFAEGTGGQVDIDCGGIQGLMSHKSFYGKQVCSVFIQMCAKGMTEGMAGKSLFPTKSLFMSMYVS